MTASNRKRLLYLAVFDPHVPLTGTGMRGAEFVNHLAACFDVDLLYMDGSGQPGDPELARRYASKIQGVQSKTMVPFKQLDYFLFSRKLYSAAQNLSRRHNYHAILCDYGLASVYGWLLSRQTGVPFLYFSHNLEYKLYQQKSRQDKRRLFLAPYVYWAERLGVTRSQALVAITPGDAEFYTRWVDQEKILVIPQGFDEQVFNPHYAPPQNNPKVVLFAANYATQFNREAVDTVMAHVLQPVLARCPNTIFRFVGANPPTDIHHPQVEFTGFVDDYAGQLKAADVVISPVLNGAGAPTKIIEALACGKPIVATEVGARSVERDYHTLHVCSIPQFPEQICSALNENMPVSAQDFEKIRSRYSWPRILANLTTLIEAQAEN